MTNVRSRSANPSRRATAPSDTTARSSGPTGRRGLVDRPPALVGGSHLVLDRRVTPVGVARQPPLVQVGGFGVRLGLVRPANDDVAQHRHPSSPARSMSRAPAPSDGGVDPVPGRRRRQCVEPAATVVPRLRTWRFRSSTFGKGGRRLVRAGHGPSPGSTAVTVPRARPADGLLDRCRSPPRAPSDRAPRPARRARSANRSGW